MATKTTVEFNEIAATELERMTKALGGVTKAEVIRSALALYSFIMTELANSNRNLAIVKDNVIEKVIAVPGLRTTVKISKASD